MKFLRRFEAQKQLLVIDMDMYVQFHGWLMEKRLIHMMMIFLFFRSFLDGESVKCAWNERNFEPDMKLRGLIDRNVTWENFSLKLWVRTFTVYHLLLDPADFLDPQTSFFIDLTHQRFPIEQSIPNLKLTRCFSSR